MTDNNEQHPGYGTPQQPYGGTGAQWPVPPQGYTAPGQQTGGYQAADPTMQWAANENPAQAGYAPPGYAPQGYAPQGQFPPQDPYAQQGFSQQQYYPGQQPGFPGQPGYGPQPPQRNRTGLIVAIAVVVVALVGGGIAAVALTRDSDDGLSGQAATSTTTTATSVKTTVPSTKSTTAAATPGFKGVVVPSMGIAYDVPTGWTVAAASETESSTGTSGTLVGFGRAYEGYNYCPGSTYRAIGFVVKSDVADLAAAATKVAKIASESGFSEKNAQPKSPSDVTTTSGIAGKMVEGAGPWKPSKEGCTANAYAVYTFAFKGPQGATLVLAIEADRNATGETTPDQAMQIIQSVRKI
ncbi:hypothetical protein H0264_08520 [Nocardia huaxiensis]|uniref:DUF8017 domain-containing protein n=1 Tax=Nocardia huaxiensis TaxID=2755382 RepID=A0A7D6VLH3_9NOCA|nr:hypothetical protein [Nocardia huaxiensis]QLY32290.1 hypothetical protein H0264_08520 [Nocardia huaxiensis]